MAELVEKNLFAHFCAVRNNLEICGLPGSGVAPVQPLSVTHPGKHSKGADLQGKPDQFCEVDCIAWVRSYDP